jgi:hypothetical protein
MKVIIDIPKEFEDDIKDNFQDFFERVKVEIAHRVNTDDTLLCGNYERETAEMLLDAFKNMNVIPKVITNGDMIKAMFPNHTISCAIPITDRNGAKFYRATINGVTDFTED